MACRIAGLPVAWVRRLLLASWSRRISPEMSGICRKARLQRERPADLLKPRRDLGVVQAGMVAAARTDELERVGVAAFHPAIHDADWLTPQGCCPAVAGLARQRECHRAFSGDAQPRVTGTVRRAGYAHGKAGSRLRTGRDARISGADHLPHQRRTGQAGLVQSGRQPQMLGICCKARLPRVRPADLLEPGWEIGVLQIGMVAAVTTDQLERAGTAALTLMRDPDRLPPQACCPAVAGLARPGKYHSTVRVNARPRATGMAFFVRCRDDAQTTRRPSTGHDARVFSTTHSASPQASGSRYCRGLEQPYRRTSILSTVMSSGSSAELSRLPANCPALAPAMPNALHCVEPDASRVQREEGPGTRTGVA
jgi:hypothetical protein